MNGFGGGGGNVLTIPELPVPSYTPSTVYTGGDNAPYATDQPALIPEPAPIPLSEPVVPTTPYYNWEAPLNLDNLNFPSESAAPSQEPFVGPPEPVSLPVTPSAPVSQEIYQTPRYSSGEQGPYVQPTYPLYQEPFEHFAPEAIRTGELKEPGYGPVEFIGDTVTTVAKVAGNIGEMAVETVIGAGKAIIDLGKFIFDRLQIGGTYTGTSTPTTYPQQPAQQPAAKTLTRGLELGLDTLANVLESQPYLTTPTTEAAPNYLLYAGLAIAGYLLLKGR